MAFGAHSPYFTFSGVDRLVRQSRRLATAQEPESSIEPMRRYARCCSLPSSLGIKQVLPRLVVSMLPSANGPTGCRGTENWRPRCWARCQLYVYLR